MIEKIIVFGGGTSGWLTAAFLTNNLPEQVQVALIEDASKGPIGVGEGTQPATASSTFFPRSRALIFNLRSLPSYEKTFSVAFSRM